MDRLDEYIENKKSINKQNKLNEENKISIVISDKLEYRKKFINLAHNTFYVGLSKVVHKSINVLIEYEYLSFTEDSCEINSIIEIKIDSEILEYCLKIKGAFEIERCGFYITLKSMQIEKTTDEKLILFSSVNNFNYNEYLISSLKYLDNFSK